MRKNNKGVLLYLSSEDLKLLDDKVRKTRYSRSGFLRAFIHDVKLKEAPSVDYQYLIREVRKVGNNIHQLLVLANSQGLIIASDLRKALDENREVEKEIRNSFVPEKEEWQ